MNTQVKENQFVWVIWSEDQVRFPAIVTEILSENEFKASVFGPDNNSTGVFRFYNSDLAWLKNY